MKLEFYVILSLFVEEPPTIGKCGQMMEDDYTVFHFTLFYVGEEVELLLNIDHIV
jgi:hypothetical protein